MQPSVRGRLRMMSCKMCGGTWWAILSCPSRGPGLARESAEPKLTGPRLVWQESWFPQPVAMVHCGRVESQVSVRNGKQNRKGVRSLRNWEAGEKGSKPGIDKQSGTLSSSIYWPQVKTEFSYLATLAGRTPGFFFLAKIKASGCDITEMQSLITHWVTAKAGVCPEGTYWLNAGCGTSVQPLDTSVIFLLDIKIPATLYLIGVLRGADKGVLCTPPLGGLEKMVVWYHYLYF